ncbi:MAG: ABC transporter substrate-binding protein [Pseudomonadota bacterium]
MKTLLMAFTVLVTFTASSQAQETREFTDDLGRTVEIPTDPQRIIGLWDWDITSALIELGAPVVGSHGRVRSDGSTYIRPANVVLGVNFDNSDITFTGAWQQFDFEVMAELEPDLIISRTRDAEMLEQLEAVGTVVFLDTSEFALVTYEKIADLVGETDQFEARLARFNALLADSRAWVGDNDYTYSVIQADSPDGAEINIYSQYSMKTYILEELGFTLVGEGAKLREQGVNRITTSPEMIPAQDADFVFGNYRIDSGADRGPRVEDEWLNAALPGYCEFLTACAEGRLVLVPREHAVTPSFQAWELLTHVIVSNVAGRPGIRVPE